MGDFITIDIGSVFSKQKPQEPTKPQVAGNPDGANNTPEEGSQKTPAKKTASKIDWSKELKKRIDENEALDPESRVPEFDVESGFWKDFFEAHWPQHIATILDKVVGEQLKKDFKILGFKKTTNPIFKFLTISHVQKEIIAPKLLNNNTYKAIHNALAKKYIAEVEFTSASDYNILYCPDLYRRSAAEMDSYFVAQKEILPISTGGNYTQERKDRNKSIFLEVGKKSVKQKGVKLKSLKEVQKMLGNKIDLSSDTEKPDKTGIQDAGKSEDEAGNKPLDTAAFVGSLKTPEHCGAALYYLVLTTQSSVASKVINKHKNTFKEINPETLVSVSKITDGKKLSKDEADNAARDIDYKLERM